MSTVVSINGQVFPPELAKISVFDRGLLYGDSVFETLGTYAGRPYALSEHVGRLRKSAELVRIDFAVSDEAISSEILRAIEVAGNQESYVRIIVTRGSGELGLDPALAVDPQRIVIVTPLHRPDAVLYEKGVGAITVRTNRATDATDAMGAKVGNYLVAVLAMEKARAAGANEALIVDRDDNVIEGATSNLFWVKGGRLWTPPESVGILSGITRAAVILAATQLGFEVGYACPKAPCLADCEELFITSSIRQLLSVVVVDNKPVADGQPGPIYRRLFEQFRQLVESQVGK